MTVVDLSPTATDRAFQVSGRNYFWDGKRFWFRAGDGSRFWPLPASKLPRHLRFDGCADPLLEIERIKRDSSIDVALPVALHAAGDVIHAGTIKILCTDEILPQAYHEAGNFPFIAKILDSVLGSDTDRFIAWIAKAMAFTRGHSPTPPETPCLVGVCESRKGILANLANMVLIGWWSPRVIGMCRPRIEPQEFEELNELLWVLNLTDCRPGVSFERNLKKILDWSKRGKRLDDVELVIRKLVMVRCHSSYWKPLEPTIRKHAPNGLIVFAAKPGLSLQEDGESMGPVRVEELAQKEIRHFRHHVLSTVGTPASRLTLGT